MINNSIKHILLLSLWGLLLPKVLLAETGQHIVWDKTPIAVDLKLGDERIVHFNEPIEVDAVQSDLNTNQVRLINNQGSLYLLAHERFQTQRLLVHLLVSKQVVLLDIQTTEQAAGFPMTVLLKEDASPVSIEKPGKDPLSDYVRLTRHALKQLYAPKRLIKAIPGFRAVPMKVTDALPLLRHQSVNIKPMMSWRYGTYTITAIKVINQSDLPFEFSPQLLRGDWLSASIYPNHHFAMSGHINDTRVLILLSKQPFEQVLAPWL